MPPPGRVLLNSPAPRAWHQGRENSGSKVVGSDTHDIGRAKTSQGVAHHSAIDTVRGYPSVVPEGVGECFQEIGARCESLDAQLGLVEIRVFEIGVFIR